MSAGELGRLDAAGVERNSTAKISTIPPMELESGHVIDHHGTI